MPLVVRLQGGTVTLLYIDHHMVSYEVPRHTDKGNGTEKLKCTAVQSYTVMFEVIISMTEFGSVQMTIWTLTCQTPTSNFVFIDQRNDSYLLR